MFCIFCDVLCFFLVFSFAMSLSFFSVPSGVHFTKQVQQTLSLILNSELIYSEIENFEFPVPETLIWVSLVKSE